MDRFVKCVEGVVVDYVRIVQFFIFFIEIFVDIYVIDMNEILLLNDGFIVMSKYFKIVQSFLEDESCGWDEGVLEDFKW